MTESLRDDADPAAVPDRLRVVGQMPSALLYLTEPFRGALDVSAMPLTAALLARAPRGDGHGVLVLPGLLASDTSTLPLRRFLRARSYHVRGWRLGRNLGPREDVLAGLPAGVRDLAERTGGPVSLIGWSLGGIYARHVAREVPGLVRQVITLGSPHGVAHGHVTHADRTFDRLGFLHARPARVPRRGDLGVEASVPSTSIYSRFDGIVGWRSCIGAQDDLHENIEVRCSHVGFGYDPATAYAVADRLGTAPTDWRPFVPPRALRPLYGRLTRPVGRS